MRVMLAKTYERENVEGWLMSEKLDGVRAVWTGEELISRNGNKFAAPDCFIAQLPKGIQLDGELWIGRGKFQATVGAVRKKTPVDSEWSKIRYCVFDAPDIPGGFEQRLATAREVLQGCNVAAVVEHHRCGEEADLNSYFRRICSEGGEGVILRDPLAAYERNRSCAMLKYKPFDSDEGEMVGIEEGKGSFSGMAGALIIKWKSVIFKVGTGLSEQQRRNPPRQGALISFGFSGLTDAGIPRFPTFISERCYE